jgi:hypothetical protein
VPASAEGDPAPDPGGPDGGGPPAASPGSFCVGPVGGPAPGPKGSGLPASDAMLASSDPKAPPSTRLASSAVESEEPDDAGCPRISSPPRPSPQAEIARAASAANTVRCGCNHWTVDGEVANGSPGTVGFFPSCAAHAVGPSGLTGADRRGAFRRSDPPGWPRPPATPEPRWAWPRDSGTRQGAPSCDLPPGRRRSERPPGSAHPRRGEGCGASG